jgi:competence protein ComEC
MLMSSPAFRAARLPGFLRSAPAAHAGPIAGWLRGGLALEQPRWPLWVPVALGIGVVLFFRLPHEPWPGLFAALTLAAALALYCARRAPALPLLVLAGLGLVALGAASAQWRAVQVAAPVLQARWGPAELTGRVVAVEIRPEGRRVILDELFLTGVPPSLTPARIRLNLRQGQRMPVTGERIAVRAQLVPPPEPVIPGGYDFARRAWFERIGAVGSARGTLRVVSSEQVGSWHLVLAAARTAAVARVLEIDPGPAGQVSAALLTGEMGHIEPGVMNAMRDSGLAHLLSISGLHISLVGGIVFFTLRIAITLVPPLALRCHAKKIAALGALLAITAYALFAAPAVPIARAWFMGAVVLIAVLIDRAPVSMRLVAWAATVILVATPEAVLGPSFQMSFAAVVALIAAWEAIARPLQRRMAGAGLAMRGLQLVAGSLATTLIASVATAPFALYHFNRVAMFAVAANLVAVPLTTFLVMPAAVLALALLPLGFDSWPIAAMNFGNALVVAIAREVAAWPAASLPAPGMPDWGLALVVLGGCWLCLWRMRWRLLALPLIAVGLVSPWTVAAPDLLISGDGRLIAWHDVARGALVLEGSGNVQMARETWQRRLGAEMVTPWPRKREGELDCAGGLCWVDRPGHRVAIVFAAGRLTEACADATLLVTSHAIWRDCPAPLWLIDRAALTRDGVHAISLLPGGLVRIETLRADRGARAWVRRPDPPPVAVGSQ